MQQRTLIRAANLATFRRALVDRALRDGPVAARRRVVIVPSRASAELLRQTMEQETAAAGGPGLVVPDLVTREEWLARLLAALPERPRWLTATERLVLFERAARHVIASRGLVGPPFRLRPGLVSAMLTFHDEIRRRGRTVRRMARVLFDELRVERGSDKGSESLINQTCFLGYTFLAYARAVEASGGVDEHALRRMLLTAQPPLDVDEVLVAVADHPADPRGLWPADFDLLGRLSTLARVEVVMTDEAHDAGFRERLETELPGIDEARAPLEVWQPRIVTPTGSGRLVHDSRDREEEVREVARVVRARAEGTGDALAGPVAVVFHRPLPYLYVAQQVLTDARVPFQAFDALPLAGEPHAALVDLVLTAAATAFSRAAVLALLRSPLLEVQVDGRRVEASDVRALGAVLADRRASGDARSFLGEVEAAGHGHHRGLDLGRASHAARAAARVADALDLCRTAASASAQVRTVVAFLQAHERVQPGSDDPQQRGRRARRAVLASLVTAADAFARHDDRPRPIDAIAAFLHHVIEGQTFAPARSHTGVHLVDAVAARFGAFDDVYLVGLVETDWSERPRRNVFYAAPLLKALGWPQDQDHVRAQQAAFRDVLTLARHRTRLSAFQLDGDTVVNHSTMLDAATSLPTLDEDPVARRPLFGDEVFTASSLPMPIDGRVGDWLACRARRPDLSDRAYSGFVAPTSGEPYRVSRVERYITCPFKYFAEHVLGLPEDRDELAGMTPLERGTLMHSIFEQFYGEWQLSGHGAITSENLPEADAMFSRIAQLAIAGLPPADRVLESLRLLGSVVAQGLADRVFMLEVSSGRQVRERLLEQELFGAFAFPVKNGLLQRDIAIRGKADRIDVLDDGSLRIVDYKLGKMPDLATSVQIGVYAHCARQWMEQRDGRAHPIASAMYIAFGDERKPEGLLARDDGPVDSAVAEKANAFAETVSRIESGEFPPRPRKLSECQWCGFAAVCRKEYQSESDDDAANAV